MEAYIPVVLVLFGAPLVTWLTIRASRPKVKADASDTLTKISLSLVEPLQERITTLETHMEEQDKKIDALEAENKSLHRWSQVLFSQVVEAGADPIPFETIQALEGN